MLNLWQQRNEAVSAGTATITAKANDGSELAGHFYYREPTLRTIII